MRFYVGTYSVPGSPGIAVCELKDDKLRLLSGYEALSNPSWLTASPDGRHLYVAARISREEASIASLRSLSTGLEPLSELASGGNNTCHLTLDDKEQLMIASHYGNGRLSLLRLEEGRVAECLQVIQHQGSGPVKGRQEGPHAHHSAFRPGTKEVFACDLGCDRIFMYSLQERLLALSDIELPAGSGPRHLVFDGPERFYACGELDSSVMFFALAGGLWQMKQRLSTIPEGVKGNSTAAIRLQGRWLYVSNRGHDSIAAFELDENGSMSLDRHIPSHGQWPRDFVPHGEGLLFANQNAGGLTYVSQSGELISALDIPGAVCVAGLQGAG